MSERELGRGVDPERVASFINDATVMVAKLRNQVDPGHIPMIKYLRRLELKLTRLKDDFVARCEVESGG